MLLQNNAVFQIVGPSGSGKTLFVCKLLQSKLFRTKFKHIYWHQGGGGEAGLTNGELCKLRKITIIDGFDDDWLKRLNTGDVIVIDDLFQEANKQADFNNLFTKTARHGNVTVIFITQNLFHQGGMHRTRNLNVHYLVLFKNPRDQTVVDYISRQAFPQHKGFLSDAFRDVTMKPHGYLFLDFTQQCPDDERVKTDIFNSEEITVYKPLV